MDIYKGYSKSTVCKEGVAGYIIKGNKATVNERYPGPDPESHL